jgi:benzoate-CoA ligase family protein
VARSGDIPRRLNLTSRFLDRNLESGPDRTALVLDERGCTYDELCRRTNRVGHVLRELGVGREDRVILALADGLDFVAAWFAVVKIGAVVSEVYTFLRPKDHAYYLRYSGAVAVVVDGTTRGGIASIARECPALRHRIVAGAADAVEGGEVSLDELARDAPEKLDPADTTGDDVAVWKFTTGSTGAPKAAVHRMRDPLLAFQAYALGVLGLDRDDVVLPVPKLFFGYARDIATLFAFGVGGAGIVFPERSTPERLFALVDRYRPTVMVQVPTMMSAMAAHPDAARHDLSCLRLATSSGEALAPEVHRRWTEAFGVEVLDGIGSSEAYHVYISNRPGAVRPGSAGQIVPGYEARIVDADGDDLPDGEAGELVVGGETTALGYWDDPEKTRRTFDGSWIRTGDLFARDADGYFHYRGRVDDLLKVGGIWVAPLEIEACLLEHPEVRQCAVVAHEELGLQYPRAYVVTRRPPQEGLAEDLVRFVRERSSPHKYPREVVFVEELPTTAAGKLDRRALAARPPARAV